MWMCTSTGKWHSAYMVYDRSISDSVFHLQRFYLCVYHSLQVHRWWAYWQAQRTSVSKDESTESMISKRVQRRTQWLVHGSPSGSIGLPGAVHQVVSKGAILVIHRESTVPTVEVLLSWSWVLSHAGRMRPAQRSAALTLSITHQTDAVKRCPVSWLELLRGFTSGRWS